MSHFIEEILDQVSKTIVERPPMEEQEPFEVEKSWNSVICVLRCCTAFFSLKKIYEKLKFRFDTYPAPGGKFTVIILVCLVLALPLDFRLAIFEFSVTGGI